MVTSLGCAFKISSTTLGRTRFSPGPLPSFEFSGSEGESENANGFSKGNRDLRHPHPGAHGTPAKDEVIRSFRSKNRIRLLAQRPTYTVRHVGLAGAIRADDGRYAFSKLKVGPIGKGLEAVDIKALEEHRRGVYTKKNPSQSLVGFGLLEISRGACPRSSVYLLLGGEKGLIIQTLCYRPIPACIHWSAFSKIARDLVITGLVVTAQMQAEVVAFLVNDARLAMVANRRYPAFGGRTANPNPTSPSSLTTPVVFPSSARRCRASASVFQGSMNVWTWFQSPGVPPTTWTPQAKLQVSRPRRNHGLRSLRIKLEADAGAVRFLELNWLYLLLFRLRGEGRCC